MRAVPLRNRQHSVEAGIQRADRSGACTKNSLAAAEQCRRWTTNR